MDFEKPIATVDIVIFTLKDGGLNLALWRRDQPPFEGSYALLGGYVHVNEDADLHETAQRVLREKASLKDLYLEQLATFSGAARDPRGWSLSVSWLALLPATELEKRESVMLVPVDDLPAVLAFDHAAIIDAAVQRLRNKSVYSTLPSFLIGDAFTIAELRDVYQMVLGVEKLDLAGFRKKILDLRAIEPIEGEMRLGTHRPAQLYRRSERHLALFNRKI
ncbi:MAG: NUDIX hydrolase [Pseudomonadota bacterium]